MKAYIWNHCLGKGQYWWYPFVLLIPAVLFIYTFIVLCWIKTKLDASMNQWAIWCPSSIRQWRPKGTQLTFGPHYSYRHSEQSWWWSHGEERLINWLIFGSRASTWQNHGIGFNTWSCTISQCTLPTLKKISEISLLGVRIEKTKEVCTGEAF